MPGASCKAALFLKSFVDGIESGTGDEEAPLRWAHIDIAGTMEVNESCLMELDTFLKFPTFRHRRQAPRLTWKRA